jgi:hypothetical protein
MNTNYDTSHVTLEQLAATHRIEQLSPDRRIFYIVESASEPGTEYLVQYNPVLKVLECLPHTGQVCQASVTA